VLPGSLLGHQKLLKFVQCDPSLADPDAPLTPPDNLFEIALYFDQTVLIQRASASSMRAQS
jgi:hypothetical protein